MSNIVPLKQCDPRWASKKLGNKTLCQIGCTCTALAMLGGITPDRVVDNADFTPEGAIYWQSLNRLGFTFHWRGYAYENEKVLGAIEKYGACLVEVLHPSGIKHWVLFIGNKKMLDPLTGKEEATSKYPNLTGYCILEAPVQKPEDSELVWLRKENGQLSKDLYDLELKYKALDGTIKEKNDDIRQLTESSESWQKEASSANANLRISLKKQGELEGKITSLEKKITKLEKELKKVTKERNDYRRRYEDKKNLSVDEQTSLQLAEILFNRLYTRMKFFFVKKSVDSPNTK